MIYSFGASNYFSFKEGMEISFELSAKTPNNISKGNKVSNVMGVKGANASGKTNILKAISFIGGFVTKSFGYKDDEGLGFSNHYRSKLPSDFYIDFEIESVRYIYELTCTPDIVIREALYKRLQRKTILVERKKNKITRRVSDLADLDLVELKANASIISTALKYKLKGGLADFSRVSRFFANSAGNVTGHGVVSDEYLFDRKSASEFYFDNEKAFDFTKEIIRNSDLGVIDIKLHKAELENGKVEYIPLFQHQLKDGEVRHLNSYEESSGTMALYRRLGLYYLILQTGGLLVMDEFDQNFHPLLLPSIINMFDDQNINTKNAQFLFTAHNTEIMDYLGKYRTILVGKEDSESFCYRLDELPGELIRNDRSIASLYRDGKLGGVPRL